jgi:pSer/pThr/pTyr-binding forkhead associated (FHA) protein
MRPASVESGVRLEAEGEARAFALAEGDTLLGRYDPVTDQRPDIDLTDIDLKRSVSRRHARIVRNAEGYFVMEEVGALNGTFVNGEKLITGRAHPLVEGDRLSLGMVKLVFRT